tara:strand:- start:12742 stop:12945 length:204 start_codon:yes stop_codon:yes gene_type:complete
VSKINELTVNTYDKHKINYEIKIEVWCEKRTDDEGKTYLLPDWEDLEEQFKHKLSEVDDEIKKYGNK